MSTTSIFKHYRTTLDMLDMEEGQTSRVHQSANGQYVMYRHHRKDIQNMYEGQSSTVRGFNDHRQSSQIT